MMTSGVSPKIKLTLLDSSPHIYVIVFDRVGNEQCSVFGERLFSSVFCSVFISERVWHFVRPLFVFGVRVLLCSVSGSDFLFCSVRCSGLVYRPMLNVNVACQC